MKRCFLFFIWLCLIEFLISCNSNVKKEFQIQNNYFANTDGNSLKIHFAKSKDTVFLRYIFIYDNGNYLNAPNDSTDYAGYFLQKNLKNNKISFNVKDYREYWRDSSRIYKLNLTFLTDSTLKWLIDSSKYGILDYLPNRRIFSSKGSDN